MRAQAKCILDLVLSRYTGPGAQELKSQVADLATADGPVTMLALTVADGVTRAVCPDGALSAFPQVVDADGSPIGEMLVWIANGVLDALEFAWWTDETPTSLPSPDQLRMPVT